MFYYESWGFSPTYLYPLMPPSLFLLLCGGIFPKSAILLLFYGIIYCYYNYYVEGLIILFCNYYELFSLSSRRRDSVLTSSVYLLHSIFLRSWFWIFSWLDIFHHWVDIEGELLVSAATIDSADWKMLSYYFYTWLQS